MAAKEKLGDTKIISVRLPVEQVKLLKAVAALFDETPNEVVRTALEEWHIAFRTRPDLEELKDAAVRRKEAILAPLFAVVAEPETTLSPVEQQSVDTE